MKRFKFRLDIVLKYKRHSEDIEKRNFHSALAKLNEEEEVLNTQLSTRRMYAERLADRLSGQLQLGYVMDHRIFIDSMNESIRVQRDKVAALEELAEKKKVVYMDALREVRKLERLEERAEREFTLESEREERFILDETALRMSPGTGVDR